MVASALYVCKMLGLKIAVEPSSPGACVGWGVLRRPVCSLLPVLYIYMGLGIKLILLGLGNKHFDH